MEIAIQFAGYPVRKSVFIFRYFATPIGAAVKLCKGRGAYDIGKLFFFFMFWKAGKKCCSI